MKPEDTVFEIVPWRVVIVPRKNGAAPRTPIESTIELPTAGQIELKLSLGGCPFLKAVVQLSGRWKDVMAEARLGMAKANMLGRKETSSSKGKTVNASVLPEFRSMSDRTNAPGMLTYNVCKQGWEFPEYRMLGSLLVELIRLRAFKAGELPRIVEDDWFSDFVKDEFFGPADEVQVAAPIDFTEGAVRRVEVDAFERNRNARRACIYHHGCCCKVCGFDFEAAYGDVGRGFIHVHHLRPLSSVRSEHRPDPIRDLVPVCPNCHAMIHSAKDPISPDDLQRRIRAAGGSKGVRA